MPTPATVAAWPVVKGTRYVPALDGVRALSILAVIAFHAEIPNLGGGFLGVEVFFVVSGYLITSLLLLEHSARGSISLLRFWRRRARRLLPALFVLLAAALVASLTLAPDALRETRADTLAAIFYVSNWWQVIQRHSYFMDVERPPLLLHLWSLAVEEQFYLIWPLLVAVLARYARRFVGPVALLGALASALWMAYLFDPHLDPTRVYVGSDTRMSGLLLGAALAAWLPAPLSGAPVAGARATAGREVLALGGLGALGWAFFQLSSRGPVLYRGGLVLVDIASCALIAGITGPCFTARVLGARPCAWLGRRSYGLYLWHWPVFALTRPEFDVALSGLSLLGLRLALTFAIAEACYRFVETPVRQGGLSRLLRTRPALFGVTIAFAAATTIALGVLASSRLARARLPTATNTTLGGHTPAAVAVSDLAAALPGTPHAEPVLGVPIDPAWPKTLTLLSDSVTLALGKALPAALPDWKVEILGHPALMVKQVVPEFLNARAVGSVVVVGLAYNSLFEKDRKHYERWSGVWDRGAERLVSDLKACGAKKVVWITLREPSPELVTNSGRDQYERYAWFFPYVNERIRALATRHPELAIADWQAVSNIPDLTQDLIHLNPAGVALMTQTITHAVLGPTPRATE
ncbi:MAG: acyltransferase family protein [Polyangiaceae bacterium]